MRRSRHSDISLSGRGTALGSRRQFAAEMRAKGYKRKTIWVVDTSAPGFEAEYRRQVASIAEHERRFRAEHPEAPEGDDLAAWAIPPWVGQGEE